VKFHPVFASIASASEDATIKVILILSFRDDLPTLQGVGL
jgi:hypothetical protein